MAKLRNQFGSTEDSLWNPGFTGEDLEYNVPDGPIRDFPVPEGPIVPAPQVPQAPTPYGGPIPQGYSQAEIDHFLADNPGDEHRIGAAFPAKQQTASPAPVQQRSADSGFNPAMDPDLVAALKGLFPGGGFNQDIVNRRVGSARDQLNSFSKSRNASNRAQLASRGLIGSGPELTAQNRAESDIADRFANAVNDIYAQESGNADQRMMQALGLFGGLGNDNARLSLDRELGLGRLDLDRMLGSGRLALDNMNSVNGYNLDLGRFGLDRDRLQYEIENGNVDQLIQLIQQLLMGAGASAGGYV